MKIFALVLCLLLLSGCESDSKNRAGSKYGPINVDNNTIGLESGGGSRIRHTVRLSLEAAPEGEPLPALRIDVVSDGSSQEQIRDCAGHFFGVIFLRQGDAEYRLLDRGSGMAILMMDPKMPSRDLSPHRTITYHVNLNRDMTSDHAPRENWETTVNGKVRTFDPAQGFAVRVGLVSLRAKNANEFEAYSEELNVEAPKKGR